MAIDRAGTLRNAEKLLRQGKLEAAIAEYARVVEDQPQDWTTANTLGDLYLRAGQSDKAVEQFARIAESLSQDGFLQKAAAVYKKILKIRPDDEQALVKAGEIAASQGVLVDARAYFGAAVERRLARGDQRGATELRIRLGSLDPADFEARRAAARARLEAGDTAGALADIKAVAGDLVEKGRHREAVDVLTEVMDRGFGDAEVRQRLFAVHLASGEFERASVYATTPDEFRSVAQGLFNRGDVKAAVALLTIENAGDDPRLLRALAEGRLRSGAVEEGLDVLRQLLQSDPACIEVVTVLGWDLVRTSPDVAFGVIGLAVDTASEKADWTAAAGALQEFVSRVPNHVPALQRLVEVCVDGGLETALTSAQARLADAYLDVGAAAEARIVAEDLVAREPSESAHAERLQRALTLLGVEPESPVVLASEEPVPPLETVQPAVPVERVAAPPVEPVRPARGLHEIDVNAILEGLDTPPPQKPQPPQRSPEPKNVEIDLTSLLAGFQNHAATSGPPKPALPKAPPPINAASLDSAFEHLREEATKRSGQDEAQREYERGLALRDAGRIPESITAFQNAARAPVWRFRAAAAAGRIHRDRGETTQAIEWFERAAEAPAATADEAHALFYELADLLESIGEPARALAICLELQSEAGDYRDLSARIDRLLKNEARG